MAWTQSGNIKGASGEPGASGASGLQGASGVPGATGPTGASGPPGTTTWSGITDKPAVIAAGVDAAAARNVISAEYTGNKGVANGYAALDSSGLVPSSQLPSFVDDVVEAANLAAFPATGDAGKIYTALDTNKVYRWGGSSYTEISPSPGSTDAVPEGSTNLYYTAARADGRITAAIGSSVQAYSATLTTYAGKTAPTGAVVGTTDTQALTNKDLSGSSNTFPAFLRRTVQTITAPTTLGASGSTDYVTFLGASGDSSYGNVTALLQGNGTNGSTVITDSSTLASNWTAFGNAKLNTTTKKYGTASISFDLGATSYIYPSAAATNFSFSSGSWTVEFYAYFNNLTGVQAVVDFRNNANGAFPLIYMTSNTLRYYVNTTDVITSSSISATTWYHVAVCKSGSTTRMFIDGTQAGSSYNDTVTYSTTASQRPLVGNSFDNFGFNGFIDDFRITKGVARYTSNFTAPGEIPTTTFGTPTLPSATSNTNRYSLRNITESSIIIGASGSQAINGATGGLSLAAGASTELVSDGTGWYSF